MSAAARSSGVKVVTGDTKVVEKGACDKIFINTSGIGIFERDIELGTRRIKQGDKVIINGDIGDHGITILTERRGLRFKHKIKSDCAPVNKLISQVLDFGVDVKFMRDPTRGGVAATLNEVVRDKKFGIVIDEKKLPVNTAVRAASELLGLDPLYIGNEGKVVMFVSGRSADKVLRVMKKNRLGRKASIIGEVVNRYKGEVCLKTRVGGLRLVDMPSAEQLPRIC